MSITASRSSRVVVVGGGPAGASAALVLARSGVEVLVLEQHRLPRYKTCGGGVVERAVRRLCIDMEAAAERKCFVAELHLQRRGMHFSTQRSHPVVWMTMRSRFDQALLEAARQAGAGVLEECRVRDVVRAGPWVRLHTTRGDIECSFLLAADGAFSRLARAAGWGPARGLIPALEYELTVPARVLDRFGSRARFDFEVVPAGYAWVFPKREHLSVGVLTLDRSVNLNRAFVEYCDLLALPGAERARRHGFAIPARPRPWPARQGILLCGDAAGLADPVTGEGISLAIHSGQLAALALVEARLRAGSAERLYCRRLEREILSELSLGRVLAGILYRRPGVRRFAFRCYGQRLCEAMTDLLSGDRTYRSILTNPAHYLKLLKPAA